MTSKHMPRTFGDAVIHQSHIDVLVECNDHQLHERHGGGPPTPEEKKIGEIIANNLVDDGATLQMGSLNSLFFYNPSKQWYICKDRLEI